MEIVDIVDEQDVILSQTLKTEAHEKGLLHRCVTGVIVDSGGGWTLVRQAANRQDAGQFVFPVGGHVSSGETYEQALKREAAEEVGFATFEFKLTGKMVFNRFVLSRQENHIFSLYEIYSEQTPVLNAESVAYKKFSRPEIIRLLKESPETFGDSLLAAVKNIYPELLP